jgi:hypothetical protein
MPERVPFNVLITRDDYLEERAVCHAEEDAQTTASKGDHIKVRPGQVAERISDRDRRDEHGTTDIRYEHHLAPTSAPVDPCTRMQGEQKVRNQECRGERTHFPGGCMKRQHGGEGQRDCGYLVTEQRDRLPNEEAPEIRVFAE